jgi:hypothetical protein
MCTPGPGRVCPHAVGPCAASGRSSPTAAAAPLATRTRRPAELAACRLDPRTRLRRSPARPPGYHSEEGWHGLIELVLGHYGIEPSEEGVVVFVGVVPVVIDVFFKYWIFIGLNRISPGAVVTIKQVRDGGPGGGFSC